MKAMYRIWMATAIMLSATACNNENELTEIAGQEGMEIRLEPLYPATTRVTDTNFEAQDQIGIYMVAEGTDLQIGGNELNNELFRFDGSAWTSERKVYWNEGTHDIYAYYPFARSVNDTKNYAFTICPDQSANTGEGMSGYEASDFLWASATGVTATAEPVKLQFSHCMSKVKVVLQKGEDYTGEIPSDCEVYIHNMVPTALVDLQTGSVEASPYAAVQSVKCRKISNTEHIACIVPQRIASRRSLVEVTSANVSYMLEGTISLKQGYQSTIIVTLSQSPEQVAIEIGGGMEDWEPAD